MDPSLAAETSKLLTRAFNDPTTKGKFREVRTEGVGISSQEPIDLVALEVSLLPTLEVLVEALFPRYPHL